MQPFRHIRDRRGARVALVGLLAAFALAGGPTTAPAAATPAADRDAAIAAAARYVDAELGLEFQPDQTYAFPSRRDPDWILVDGFDRRVRPWAVFLEREGNGWVVRAGSAPPRPGPPAAPCDIRYPFSEPACD